MKAFLLAALGLLASAQAEAAVLTPNVVFILADDSGFADFGCYGHPYARTPNIDRLAGEGTRFRQFYATGVTCCPARTGLMTSRWPAQYATYPANGGFGDRVTITELLHRAGYATGHFGKWHMGPVQKPGTYGIDSIGAEDAPAASRNQIERGRDAPIYDDAIRFIEKNRDRPFYVNVWSHTSHYPVNPPERYVKLFQDVVVDESKFGASMREKFALCKARGGDVSEHMRRYLADLYAMDEDIGRLLRRLDELGLREKTLVVFSSDQGPAPIRESDEKDPDARKKRGKTKAGGANNATELRLNAMGYTGEFRGGKHGMFEGGVRVPFIVRWPGHVLANRVDETSVMSGADWLPTLCALIGVKTKETDFDGVNVSEAWLGRSLAERTKPLFWKTSAPGSDAAMREGPWKLIVPTRRRGPVELYHIPSDPGEAKNVAKENPAVVKKLSAQVQAWVATLPKSYVKTDDPEK